MSTALPWSPGNGGEAATCCGWRLPARAVARITVMEAEGTCKAEKHLLLKLSLPSPQLKGALGMVPSKDKDCFTTWAPLRSRGRGDSMTPAGLAPLLFLATGEFHWRGPAAPTGTSSHLHLLEPSGGWEGTTDVGEVLRCVWPSCADSRGSRAWRQGWLCSRQPSRCPSPC